MSNIIGLAGKAKSGKDTIANYLKLHYPFQSVAFADPIREGMRAILGLEDRHFAHPDKEVVIPEFGKSPRQMMQTLGTEWGRNCVNDDLWLILAKKKIDAYHKLGFNVVITDVRFENEADMIRKAGGVIWHIERGVAGTPHGHASEAGVQKGAFDWIISNNGTLASLYGTVDSILERMHG
jgi:hypothetical protein